jgi:hypothetical protein
MKKIEFDDLMSLEAYEAIRDDLRRQVIEVKKRRRLQAGPRISLLFENRDTVLFQIQEMLRVEHVSEQARVQEEIDTYNDLIPDNGELSATLFLEFENSRKVPEELPRFTGIEASVSLRVGEHNVEAVPLEVRSKEDVTSTLHYLRFPLSAQAREAFRRSEKAFLVIAHRNYSQIVELEEPMQAELVRDLA